MPFIVVVKGGKKQEEYDEFYSKAKARAWARKMGLKAYDVVYLEYVKSNPVHLAPASQSQSLIWSQMKKQHRRSSVVSAKKKNKTGYDKWGRNPALKAVRRVYQGGLPGSGKKA